MAKAIAGFSIIKQTLYSSSNLHPHKSTHIPLQFMQLPNSGVFSHRQLTEGSKRQRGSLGRVNAFPDWPLMAVLVDHLDGQRDLVTHKSIVHLSDEAIKNVYSLYIMFTCWGCLFFGSMKDPYYDSEVYRKDGGDGTGHWVYEKQEDIEEAARAELWREELIEEIEQKVGGLRELEEAGKK
ncbi:photosynthetic NDH subunit of subcomplex B 4, chloroplastic isoform X1 [Cucurbita pepo subsp. pepo]|uniref:photosynthetic NDH subunit of subcomplex B 4, chloroplastic isoform X1 n=1 Tax=Cucurbita pepo subsp. pepo TaxID=3664 RepID=UPI000C9D9B0C|nr:photosynthetic NDH subunit of subcomplex B 4, chloroplastic isoform X1 [Cucurbita pepo subsp. pepo]